MHICIRRMVRPGHCALLALASSLIAWPVLGATGGGADATVASLRAEIETLRAEYARRLAELEGRLTRLETGGQRAGSATRPPDAAEQGGARSVIAGGRAFNPAIGVIFQGQAWRADRPDERQGFPGFPLGGEAGPPPRGLAVAETELVISANVDDKFTAWLTAPIVIEDGQTSIEIEEAWIETMGLPAGLGVRFGRFFSRIGYLNERHAHTWDFIDQPLLSEVLPRQFVFRF